MGQEGSRSVYDADTDRTGGSRRRRFVARRLPRDGVRVGSEEDDGNNGLGRLTQQLGPFGLLALATSAFQAYRSAQQENHMTSDHQDFFTLWAHRRVNNDHSGGEEAHPCPSRRLSSDPEPIAIPQCLIEATSEDLQDALRSARLATGSSLVAIQPEDVDLCICPITQCLMSDPVQTIDGQTYDRSGITQWLESHHTSPLTNLPLTSFILVPDMRRRELVHLIVDLIRAYPQYCTFWRDEEGTEGGSAPHPGSHSNEGNGEEQWAHPAPASSSSSSLPSVSSFNNSSRAVHSRGEDYSTSLSDMGVAAVASETPRGRAALLRRRGPEQQVRGGGASSSSSSSILLATSSENSALTTPSLSDDEITEFLLENEEEEEQNAEELVEAIRIQVPHSLRRCSVEELQSQLQRAQQQRQAHRFELLESVTQELSGDALNEFLEEFALSVSILNAHFALLSKESISRCICPITHRLMSNPVEASDGVTYEASAILRWMEEHDDSPVVPNTPLRDRRLTPNMEIRDLVEKLVQSLRIL